MQKTGLRFQSCFPFVSAAERSLKQEQVLPEDITNSQGTDRDSLSHEAEDAHTATKISQVILVFVSVYYV